MDRSWILVGMMGAGKSAVGRSLSALNGRAFIDTDTLLQHRFGRPINQIFEIYGEEAFRDHETNILKSLESGPTVISTGGGIVLREANWTEFQRLGTTIYLHVEPQTLVARLEVSKKRRPLLQGEDWAAKLTDLLDRREEFYRRSDICVEVGDTDVEGAAQRVRAALEASP